MDVDSASAPIAAIEEELDDDAEEIPEDEYEIEAILSHEIGRFKKHEIAYLVKWLGYTAEHNSWVREGDAENAPDMINNYWATASKEGVARKASGTGWTGARSTKRLIKKERISPTASISPSRSRKTAVFGSGQEEQIAKKRARTASQASYSRPGLEITEIAPFEEMDEAILKASKKMSGEERNRRKIQMANYRYLNMAEWESVVRHVETVERLENGKLIAFLIFENGERYAYEASVVNHRCPQKMIAFYESRLRFKTDPVQLPPLTTTSALDEENKNVRGDGELAREQTGEQRMGEVVAEEQRRSAPFALEPVPETSALQDETVVAQQTNPDGGENGGSQGMEQSGA